MLCCALAGEGDIYAIALYHTKQSLASITTATDAGEYSQLGSGVQKQRSPRPSPPVRLPSDFLPLREAPGVLSCPQIPPPRPQIVIPVSRRAKRRLFNKDSLRRLFLFFFFQILILSLFISGKIFHVSVFFHSEFNFRPSVGCLAAGHRHQTKARFMQMAEEEFLRDRSRSVCTSLYLTPNRHISFHFLLRCLQ